MASGPPGAVTCGLGPAPGAGYIRGGAHAVGLFRSGFAGVVQVRRGRRGPGRAGPGGGGVSRDAGGEASASGWGSRGRHGEQRRQPQRREGDHGR